MKHGVAVVLPCYNLGRTIEEAIDSALEQTRPVEEVIVVDDGSTDQYTQQVLAQLRRPRTRVIRTDNQGLSRARNHGIEASTADYVTLLDADDLLDPSYVELCAARLDADPNLDFVCCAMQAFEGASYYWLPNADIVTGIVKGSLHASTMFRRRVYTAVGGFDPDMPAFEASDFWICAMELGFKGHILPEPLLRYRIRWDSKYHHATHPDRFRAARTAMLQKHALTVQQDLGEVIALTDSFLVEVGQHQRHLVAQRTRLIQESVALEHEHAALVRDLAARGTGAVDRGDLASSTPLGDPDSRSLRRYYTHRFLMAHRAALRGVVLTDDPELCSWLGDEADLIQRWNLKSISDAASADAIVLTHPPADPAQLRLTLEASQTALRPGGVLLAMLPSVEHFEPAEPQWRATEAAVRQMLYRYFDCDSVETRASGNVQVCAAALHGLTDGDLDPDSLNFTDPWFPFMTGVRAIKKRSGAATPICRVGRSAATTGAERGAILMYHRVAHVGSDARQLTLSPSDFSDHLDYLGTDYNPISLEEMARASREGTLRHRSVAVTLDDGYIDSLTIASPLLSAHQIPATFFINSANLDVENEFWGDTVERIFLEESRLPARIRLLVGPDVIDLPTGTAAERRVAWGTMSARFYPLSALDRVSLLDDVVRWSELALHPRRTHRRMIAEEVVALSRRPGHTIGAHTVNHLDLTAHPPEVRRHEIAENRWQLERLIEKPVLTFSYPYGIHNAEIVSIARAVPFFCAVTVEGGLVHEGGDLLRLPRLEVPLNGINEFREFLDGWFERGHSAG